MRIRRGTPLLESQTFYGAVGDRPVVAFQYVDGYQPQAYNLTGTLSSNEAENVFTFTYTETEAPAGTEQTPDGGTAVPERAEVLRRRRAARHRRRVQRLREPRKARRTPGLRVTGQKPQAAGRTQDRKVL